MIISLIIFQYFIGQVHASLQIRAIVLVTGKESCLCGIIRLTNFYSPIVTSWCPSGYLGHSLSKFGSHYPPPFAGLFDLQILMRLTFKI